MKLRAINLGTIGSSAKTLPLTIPGTHVHSLLTASFKTHPILVRKCSAQRPHGERLQDGALRLESKSCSHWRQAAALCG